MNFPQLLGNETIKERLQASLERNQLSHCYLISGPTGSGKHTLARLLAAAMECTGSRKPCLVCPQCKKVLTNNHPDFITVDDTEHKTIPVKVVRDACADLYLRPNEGNKKIYFFPQGQNLNLQGQNTLLKCIEEPPSYGVFLLLADHSEQLLPTIRSRCVELRLSPLPEALLRQELTRRYPQAEPAVLQSAILRSGGYLGQAAALMEETSGLLPQTPGFVEAFCKNTPGSLLRVFTPMEKLKREQLRPILLEWYRLLADAAACQGGMPPACPEAKKIAQTCSPSHIMSAIDRLHRSVELVDGNVGVGHICGMLSITLNQI